MNVKSVEAVIAPREPHYVGDGFRVHNFIPSHPLLSMERMSPFIMLDYNSKHFFAPSASPRGVGAHPHRGFETVSIAYKGRIAHADSHGNAGVIGEGDVQWMTAASGVLHKEFHEEAFSRAGGDFHMVQLWVNLPAKDKMSPPRYQAILNAQMPRSPLADGLGEVEIIAGEHAGARGPALTFTAVNLMNAKLKKGGKATFSFPASHNSALLVIEGRVRVNGDIDVPTDDFVLFSNDGTDFEVEGLSDEAIALVLSGEPIREPIAAHGPFVMNTRAELGQAFYDFQAGKFGYLD